MRACDIHLTVLTHHKHTQTRTPAQSISTRAVIFVSSLQHKATRLPSTSNFSALHTRSERGRERAKRGSKDIESTYSFPISSYIPTLNTLLCRASDHDVVDIMQQHIVQHTHAHPHPPHVHMDSQRCANASICAHDKVSRRALGATRKRSN